MSTKTKFDPTLVSNLLKVGVREAKESSTAPVLRAVPVTPAPVAETAPGGIQEAPEAVSPVSAPVAAAVALADMPKVPQADLNIEAKSANEEGRGVRRRPVQTKPQEPDAANPVKRGRPALATAKEQVTVYLRPSTHQRLVVGASIAGRPMAHIVEELVEAWCSKNAGAIDAALAVLDPSKLRTKIQIS